MARLGPSMGNSISQRVKQAKFGDIAIRYGKDKRSNVNKKVPSSFKVREYGSKLEGRHSLGSSNRIVRVSREYLNQNRITLSSFIRWTLFISISILYVYVYIAGDDASGIQRQRRSIEEVISDITNKFMPSGYTGGQSAAAWTRQRRSNGAHSDDMSNPHNGASNDGESIIQKMLADFAKLIKTESEGYQSENKNNENIINENTNNNNDL